MITIAIDPGLMTGTAIWCPDWAVPYNEEIRTREEFYNWLTEKFARYSGEEMEVVIESFNITSRTGQLSPQYDALYIIGATEFLCQVDKRHLFMQSPALKSFGSNNKLHTLGWYAPSRGGHANDANRHLLRHLVCTRQNADLIKRLEVLL